MRGPNACCGRTHYVCFSCRRSRKGPSNHEVRRKGKEWAVVSRNLRVGCPECGKVMKDLGPDFKPPRKRDLEQWKKVQMLYRNGFAYDPGCCSDPGYRPARLRDVPAFLEQEKITTRGERLSKEFKRPRKK